MPSRKKPTADTPPWRDVRCASLPEDCLALLADLRGRAEIRVAFARGRAWIEWNEQPGLAPELLARRIVSIPGVELYTERGGLWFRLGDHLPSWDVPFRDQSAGQSLDRAIVPSKLSVLRPRGEAPSPLPLRVTRDTSGRARTATAFRAPLQAVADWAETASQVDFAPLAAAGLVDPNREPGLSEVVVIAPAAALPLISDSVRYWGTDLLIPLGWRAEPDLPASAIRCAAGADDGDLAILDDRGLELIARDAFAPLSRAAVRLANKRALSHAPRGGPRE
jgi:hypothetical protein